MSLWKKKSSYPDEISRQHATLPEKEPTDKAPAAVNPSGAFEEDHLESIEKGSGSVSEEEEDMKESDLTASISRNTTIKGDLFSQDNIDIFGIVEGTVTSAAVVKAYGTITGDISCGVLVANHAQIIGNITCENAAVLGNATTVKGNIHAKNVSISGKVDGNISAAETVSINSDGIVIGDIETAVVEVSKGAVLYGAIVMDLNQKQPVPPVEDKPLELTYAQPAEEDTEVPQTQEA